MGRYFPKGLLMKTQYVPNSFVQTEKHLTKSDKFQVITPDAIRQVLDAHGFDLVHLKSGRAKNQDRADFQTTVARYRSRDQFEIDGLGFDLIFKVPHLYGKLVGVLGLFRGVCANQMNVGQWFECIKVAHMGNPADALNTLIPQLVAQRAKLIEQVKAMQARNVTPTELVALANEIAQIRLAGVENVSIIHAKSLLTPRRNEDTGQDLFTVLNVLQENALRYGIGYQTQTPIDLGNGVIEMRERNMVTRKVSDKSVKAIDLNASIWDAATKLLNAA